MNTSLGRCYQLSVSVCGGVSGYVHSVPGKHNHTLEMVQHTEKMDLSGIERPTDPPTDKQNVAFPRISIK